MHGIECCHFLLGDNRLVEVFSIQFGFPELRQVDDLSRLGFPDPSQKLFREWAAALIRVRDLDHMDKYLKTLWFAMIGTFQNLPDRVDDFRCDVLSRKFSTNDRRFV